MRPEPVEFLWLFQTRCDYPCPYCGFSLNDGRLRRELTAQERKYPLERWLEAWERVYERYGPAVVYITGSGEPTLYPRMEELLAGLAARHDVTMDTNLSWSMERLRRLREQAPPSRLKLATSFHPHTASIDEFVEKAAFVKAAGYRYECRCVAYPPLFDRLPEFRRRFHERGLTFSATPFFGEHEGAAYPQAYTAEQRRLLLEWAAEEAPRDPAVVEAEHIRRMCDVHVDDPSGKRCRSGARYACIMPSGLVYRCQEYGMAGWETLGSFFDAAFSLREEFVVCRSNRCQTEQRWLVPEGEEAR